MKRRYLREARAMFKAWRRADERHHFFCRECDYELSLREAYYSDDEQARIFPDAKFVRIPKKDCPSCGAKYVSGATPHERPFYEPLYVRPPRDMCWRLMIDALKDAFLIRTLYSYPDGYSGTKREVIKQWRGRDLSRRMMANPRERS